MSDDGYDVIGDTKMIIIVDARTRDVVGAAYAEDDDRWWRSVLHGRVRRLYVLPHLPDPHLDVARRLRR